MTRRLFIFGWDAADWVVIEEGWRRGMLSTLHGISERGQSGTLLSTIPPVTPSAWTSFLTGVGAGEHGIFNFRTVRSTDHRVVPTQGGMRRVPTLIGGLDAARISTCLVTVPWTYPAEPLQHGVVVPGWDDPSEGFESTWPIEAGRLLAAEVSRVPRRVAFHGEPGRYLRRLAEDVALRERISDLLMAAFDPRLFMVVYVEPDRAGHLLWTNGSVPSALVEAYEQVDKALGRFMRRWVNDDDVVLVVSDHGTRPVHSVVQIGSLLEAGGWLTLVRDRDSAPRLARNIKRSVWSRIPPRLRNKIWRNLPSDIAKKARRNVRRSSVDWGKTVAFPLGNNPDGVGVWINSQPPFADGLVKPAEYREVRDGLVRHLADITDPDSGERVFARVVPREDVYTGGAVDGAPDLVLIPKEGYGASQGKGVDGPLVRVAAGGHRPEGVYLASCGLGLASTMRIEDLLPAVLQELGYPVGNGHGMEGESVAYQHDADPGYGQEEEEEIEGRLRDLGYID